MPAARKWIDTADAERLRGLLQATTDPIEKRHLRGLLQYATPESRVRHGELTRRKMNHPSVKQKIADGMARANAPELVALREAWRHAPAEIREKFLAEIARIVPADQKLCAMTGAAKIFGARPDEARRG